MAVDQFQILFVFDFAKFGNQVTGAIHNGCQCNLPIISEHRRDTWDD